MHYKDYLYIQNRLINRIEPLCIFNKDYESECYKTSANDCLECSGFPTKEYETSWYDHSR